MPTLRSLVLTLAVFGVISFDLTSPAFAATCEESFQKKGDFFNGTAFSARVQIEGGTIEQAFSQLRPILARDGIQTVSTDVSSGVMKAINPATAFQRALPIDVFGTMDGSLLTVEMVFTLPSGVTAGRDTVRKHLCGALNQLLPKGKPTAAVPVQKDAPAVEIQATTLGTQVQQAADNPARLRLNFIGKIFRVTGKVVAIAEQGSSYAVSFDAQPPTPNRAKPGQQPMTVVCSMAKNQDATVATLEMNQSATLIGRLQGFDSKANAVQLQDCIGG